MWRRPGLFRARAHPGWRRVHSDRSNLLAAAAAATGESVPKVAVNLSPRGRAGRRKSRLPPATVLSSHPRGVPTLSPCLSSPPSLPVSLCGNSARDRNAPRTSVMIWLISECHPLIGIYELDCREGGNSVVLLPSPPPSFQRRGAGLCLLGLLDFSCNTRCYIPFFELPQLSAFWSPSFSLSLSSSVFCFFTCPIHLICIFIMGLSLFYLDVSIYIASILII